MLSGRAATISGVSPSAWRAFAPAHSCHPCAAPRRSRRSPVASSVDHRASRRRRAMAAKRRRRTGRAVELARRRRRHRRRERAQRRPGRRQRPAANESARARSLRGGSSDEGLPALRRGGDGDAGARGLTSSRSLAAVRSAARRNGASSRLVQSERPNTLRLRSPANLMGAPRRAAIASAPRARSIAPGWAPSSPSSLASPSEGRRGGMLRCMLASVAGALHAGGSLYGSPRLGRRPPSRRARGTCAEAHDDIRARVAAALARSDVRVALGVPVLVQRHVVGRAAEAARREPLQRRPRLALPRG